MILNDEFFSNQLYSATILLLEVSKYVLLAFNIILFICNIVLGTWNEPQFYLSCLFYFAFFGFYKKLFAHVKNL